MCNQDKNDMDKKGGDSKDIRTPCNTCCDQSWIIDASKMRVAYCKKCYKFRYESHFLCMYMGVQYQKKVCNVCSFAPNWRAKQKNASIEEGVGIESEEREIGTG